MNSYEKLIRGYNEFRGRYLGKENLDWRNWAKERQAPKVMIIACSDSRVNPIIVTHAALGDIFVVNNVANLVPPYKEGKLTHHSTSAAIEYAVNHLHVEHIIVMGHSGCGGIRALMSDNEEAEDIDQEKGAYSFIKPWMKIVEEAADFTEEEKERYDEEELLCMCEKRAVLISLNNLATFPWVKKSVLSGHLKIHAWHFDIASGVLLEYDRAEDDFIALK